MFTINKDKLTKNFPNCRRCGLIVLSILIDVRKTFVTVKLLDQYTRIFILRSNLL